MKNLDFHSTVIYPESLPDLQADMDSSQVNDSLRVIRLRTQNLVVKQTFLDLPGELKNTTVEENFARFLVGGDYPIVHFQDLSGWGTLALSLIAKQLDKKVIISLSNYFLLCPDRKMVLPNGEPCGKVIADGQEQQCLQCLAAKQEIFVREVLPLDKFLSERNGLVRQILQKADVLIAASSAIRERFIRAFEFLTEKIQVTKTSEGEPDNDTHIYNNLLTEEAPKTPALQDQTAPFIQRLLGNETPAPVFLGDNDYKKWLEKQSVIAIESPLSPLIPHLQKEGVPKVHLLIHLRRPQEKYLKTTLKALSAQAYPHWHLSIIADFNTTDRAVWEIKNLRWLNVGSDDPIRVINHEIAVIKADWVALIEAGDSCETPLLSHCINAIDHYPDWQLIYVDEDSLSTRLERYDPKFKPEVNLDLLRTMPYLGHFCLVRREAQQAIGGYAPYSGMENYDIALKILDYYGEVAIGHIAQMLYHRLDINEQHNNDYGKDILRQHLKRNAIRADIHHTEFSGIYWIDYPLQDNALVSIIIATRNSLQSLQRCLQSLIKLTAYPHYEIIVVDNNSDHSDTSNYLNELKADNRIRVLQYTVEANISELNNFAAQQAKGEYLLFLNDDTEIIQAAWLQRLLALNQRQEIGIVGARLLDADQNARQAGLILGMGAVGIAGQVNQGLPHNALGYMGRNQAVQNFSAVSEDCLMIDKSLYQTIGGMDENAILFNEVDFCLRVKEKGYQIVWTPHVSLVQHGLGSLVRNRRKEIKETQVEQEMAAMYKKWLPQLSTDPAYNPLLRLKGDAWKPEIQIAVPWDIHLHEKPRIVAYPYDAWGVGEYRVRAPLRALQKADLANYALMPNHELLRMPTPSELARMQTDTLFIHNMLHDDNLRALEQYKRFNSCFKIFGQDDLIYALPKTNPYYHTNYKDIKARVQMAISLCDRLIVATEPLLEAYRNICDDIWIMPNYLEWRRWCDIETVEEEYKPDRFTQKPRVGWAGARQHLGDLQLIIPVVKTLANEVDWIFFGMCPDELRPYVREYHDMVPFELYPAKLASLNLDLAIAPLEKNAFNETKSNLRLLEYGILGYPIVCSDIYPYQNAPVTRVSNTHQAWLNAIRAHIHDLKATKQAGHHLKQWVFDNWLLENHIDEWAQALNIVALTESILIHSPMRFSSPTVKSPVAAEIASIPFSPPTIESPTTSSHCIFILGSYNSGTDLLASLLCKHESIVQVADNKMFLVDALSIDIAIPFLWTEKEPLVAQLPAEKNEFEQKKTAWLKSLQQQPNRFFVIENLPTGMAKSLWLQEQFSGAHFILMVRNGYAVALELQDKIRQHDEIEPLLLHRTARQWSRSLELFQEAAPKLDNFLEVRYENLMDDPENVTKKIFDFVNLSPLNTEALRQSLQQQDSPFATSPQNATSLARMSAAQWAVIKNGAGNLLAHYNYIEKTAQDANTQNNLEQPKNYSQWIEKYDTLSQAQCQQISQKILQWQQKRLISIIMPVYNTNEKWLRIAIESVRQQIYPYWELCIADDASTKPHIRETLEEFAQLDKRIKVLFRKENGHISAASNSALEIATGELIALVDHDDKLPAYALYKVAETLNKYPDVDLIYSDEDKLDEAEQRYAPYFKSDWNPDLFYSHNCISHLGVYRRSLVNEIGGFRLGYEGSQDYDLALRVIEQTTSERIKHIPHVLYHWRAIKGSTARTSSEKPYAIHAAQKAIREHLERQNIHARVTESAEIAGMTRVQYFLPTHPPLVSLIIATRDHVELLHGIVDGIFNDTDYKNIELIILDNASVEAKTWDYFERLKLDARVKIIHHDAPFNFSELNNIGVSRSSGEIIGLLNNDLEVISSGWLTEMVSHALRPEIGIVGARLWYPNDTLQHGGVILGIGGIAGHAHKGLPRGHVGYSGRAVIIQNFSAVTGACMVMRKTVFNAVGGLDEKNLAIALNDVDFCLKVNQLGLRVVWTPYAELYHHESASRGYENTPEKQARYKKECDYIKRHWSQIFKSDPAYSPNLTLNHEYFSIACPPRMRTLTAGRNLPRP